MNKIKEKLLVQLLFSLFLNILFFALVWKWCYFSFEANDDIFISSFVDGSLGERSVYLPFVNIIIGFILKALYSLPLDLPWYTLLELGTMFCSFTAITFWFVRRYQYFLGTVLSLIVLFIFGLNDYASITFTKVAGLSATAGVLLLFLAFESLVKQNKSSRPNGRFYIVFTSIVGSLLCLMGFMFRDFMALPVFFLTAIIGVPYLSELIRDKDIPFRGKISHFFHSAIPFFLMFSIILGAHFFNAVAWNRPDYAEWLEYNSARIAILDYKPVIPYTYAKKQYEQAGILETDLALLGCYNLSDTEVFTPDFMRTLRQISLSVKPENFTLRKGFHSFFNRLIYGFIHEPYVQITLASLLLWLICGKKDPGALVSVGLWILLFSILYLFLIFKGRYHFSRVDSGLMLTGFIIFTSLIKPGLSARNSILLPLTLCVSILICYYYTPDTMLRFGVYPQERSQNELMCSSLDLLCEETDNIFICSDSLQLCRISFPFKTVSPGSQHLIINYGWGCQHPAIRSLLSKSGIENPYRDSTQNEYVLWIDSNIDITLNYIRARYCPDAYAERNELLSSQTGLDIYRILSASHTE